MTFRVRTISLAFVTCIALFSSVLAAGDELLTERYFFPQDVFFIDGTDYTVNIDESGDQVFIAAKGSYYVIDEDDCETQNYIRICFTGTAYDASRNQEKAYLKVYSSTPDISITQTADSSTLHLDDDVDITVVVANGGSVDSELITFTQEIPDGFAVEGVGSGVSADDDALTWTGTIDAGDSETFTYTLVAVSDDAVSFKSHAQFFDGFSQETVYSNSLSLTISPPQTTTITASDTTIIVGDEIDLDVAITNTDSKKIYVDNLRIVIPDNFVIVDTDWLLEQDGNVLTYSGYISTNSTETLDITLQAIYDTVADITVDGSILKGDYTTTIDESEAITVTIPDLILRPYIIVDNVFPLERKTYTPTNDKFTLEGSQNARFELYIDNPSDEYDLQNLAITITSDMFQNASVQKITIPEILAGNGKKVFNRTFTTPALSSSKTYDLDYSILYSTSYGYEYTYDLEQSASISPIKDLDVKHAYSVSSPVSGESVKVTVTVKNNRDLDVNDVLVTDMVPDLFTVKGPTSAKLDITEGETVTAYEYYLIVPIIGAETSYDILNVLSYEDASNIYAYNTTSTVKVKPRSPDITLTKSTAVKTALLGEAVGISYALQNEEDYRVTDLNISFPAVEKTYLVDAISYVVKTLDPGASKSLTDIEKRIFLEEADSSLSIPASTYTFTDEVGVNYTDETGKLSMKVDPGTFTLPLLDITKELDGFDTETTMYTITIENFGTTDAVFTLVDAGTAEEMTLSAGETTTYSGRVATPSLADSDYILQRSYLQFSKGDSTYYAVTDPIDLEIDDSYFAVDDADEEVEILPEETVTEPEQNTTDTIIDTEMNASENTTSEPDETITEPVAEPGFFARIAAFFKNLFGGSS